MSNDNNYRLNVELSILKFEAEGTDKDWVEHMANKFFPPAIKAATRLRKYSPNEIDNSQQLALFDEPDAATTSPDDTAPEHQDTIVSQANSVESSQINLREFYHKFTPESQSDILTIIAGWYKSVCNMEEFTSEDMLTKMRDLAYYGVPTPEPKGLSYQIKNARRKGYLYATMSDSGRYSITKVGEDRLDEIKIKQE